jgi:Fe-S cluster biosynthesis and repair protein YggX
MSRTVFCRKYQTELEGLDFAPFPTAKGQEVFETVSKQAWQEWLKHQTLLINENRLNVMQPESRAFLDQQRDKFLSGEDYERPTGWTPPSAS